MIKIKKILFPTNCSPSAQKALAYTLAIAKYFAAEIVVLYVCELKVDMMAPSILRYQLQQEEKKKAQKLLNRFVKSVANTNTNIQQEVEIGFIKESVAIYTHKNKTIDLVALGVNDESSFKKAIWGTTTSSIIDGVDIPVLVIPKGIVFQKIKNIAYVSPENQYWQLMESALNELADYFEAQLYITHLAASQTTNILKQKNHILLEDYKGALQSLIHNQNLNLVVTCTSARNTLQRMFKYSNAQKMALKVTIPLLIWKK